MAEAAAGFVPAKASGASVGGRLWQNGRLARGYDRIGPCLGSGGMGSVWAARVSRDGAADSSACEGNWVAVKAIPMASADGAQTGLRECLSTFSDLSTKHVLRYERYWLEEPSQLPPEVRRFCGGGGGGVGCGAAARRPAPPLMGEHAVIGATGTATPTGTALGSDTLPPCGVNSGRLVDSDIFTQSLRFRDISSGGLRSPAGSPEAFCHTPFSAGCESSGFVWESDSSAENCDDASPRATDLGCEAACPSNEEQDQSAIAAAVPGHAGCKDDISSRRPGVRVVLLIEMELMGEPPEATIGTASSSQEERREKPREERVTLRAWLQRSGRTLSDAADVFGCLILSVRHIHRKRIVHADLKPDNIFCVMLDSRVTMVRIGDFGLAGENQLFRRSLPGYALEGYATAQPTLGGTPGYTAPEILKCERRVFPIDECPCSDKVDIFACSLILLELLLDPVGTHMERALLLERFHMPKDVPHFINAKLPKTRLLLTEMSEQDPAQRLSAEEVCKRFEKEVRKELCRSAMQPVCSAECSDGIGGAGAAATASQPLLPTSSKGGEPGTAGGGRQGNGHRRASGKGGRGRRRN